MQIIDRGQGNVIVADFDPDSNVIINIYGDNNHVNVGNFKTLDFAINLRGSNNEITIRDLHHAHRLKLAIRSNCRIVIGAHTTIQEANIVAEEADVIVGEDCMFSNGIMIRTNDAHGIYDLESGALVNRSGSIEIGKHVWLAQGVLVGRHSRIGDHCVIGAKSFVQKKDIPAHCVAAGSPAKVVKRGITWDRHVCENIYAEDAPIDDVMRQHLAEISAVRANVQTESAPSGLTNIVSALRSGRLPRLRRP